MDDAETAVIRRVGRGSQRPSAWGGRSSAIGPATGRHASESAAGLSSLSFIIAALRRRFRVWCTVAVLGLIVGGGLFALKPPGYTAAAQVYLTPGPNENLGDAIDTNVELAESRPVALAALHQLGLHESVGSFLASYGATSLTTQIMTISIKTSSPSLATRSANALTLAFLHFRAVQMGVYEQLVSAAAGRQLAQAEAQAGPVAAHITSLTDNGTTSAEKPKILLLQQQMNLLGAEESTARAAQQNVTSSAATAIRGSRVLNPATLTGKSRKKTAVIYALSGLLAGLVLSMFVVVVGALVSERLRARDDIAHALGAPVRLSTGPVSLGWQHRRRLRLADADRPAVQRIAAYVEDGLPDGSQAAALAFVPAARCEVAALTMVALARSFARRGKRVIIADLWPGAPVARLLGAREPGIHRLEVAGTDSRLAVVVPARSDIGPTGPLTPAAPAEALTRRSPLSAELADAYASADLMLTLVNLEPALGSDHLSTWAEDVAVIVTAGQSTWARLQAVGEMVRLARARIAAVVLVGSDQSDDSLGQAYDPEARPDPRAVDRREDRAGRDAAPQAAHNGVEVAVTADGPGARPSSR